MFVVLCAVNAVFSFPVFVLNRAWWLTRYSLSFNRQLFEILHLNHAVYGNALVSAAAIFFLQIISE